MKSLKQVFNRNCHTAATVLTCLGDWTNLKKDQRLNSFSYFRNRFRRMRLILNLPTYLSYSTFQLLFNTISSFFPNAPPQLQSCKSVEHNIPEERAKNEKNNSSQTPVSSELWLWTMWIWAGISYRINTRQKIIWNSDFAFFKEMKQNWDNLEGQTTKYKLKHKITQCWFCDHRLLSIYRPSHTFPTLTHTKCL